MRRVLPCISPTTWNLKPKDKDIHTRRMAYLTQFSIPSLLSPMINKMADEASAILLLISPHEVWVKVTVWLIHGLVLMLLLMSTQFSLVNSITPHPCRSFPLHKGCCDNSMSVLTINSVSVYNKSDLAAVAFVAAGLSVPRDPQWIENSMERFKPGSRMPPKYPRRGRGYCLFCLNKDWLDLTWPPKYLRRSRRYCLRYNSDIWGNKAAVNKKHRRSLPPAPLRSWTWVNFAGMREVKTDKALVAGDFCSHIGTVSQAVPAAMS